MREINFSFLDQSDLFFKHDSNDFVQLATWKLPTAQNVILINLLEEVTGEMCQLRTTHFPYYC